jgi:hypothetical protein
VDANGTVTDFAVTNPNGNPNLTSLEFKSNFTQILNNQNIF